MSSWLVFNHHSLPFEDRYRAIHAVPIFIQICLQARNKGLSTILMEEQQGQNWFHIALAEGYFWRDWHKQHKSIEKDQIQAFLQIATSNYPLIDDTLEFLQVTIEWNGKVEYSALGAAAYYRSPLVSFPTKHPWNSSPIPVTTHLKGEKTEVRLQNLYQLEGIEKILDALQKENDSFLFSIKDLIQNINKLYPHIIFCDTMMQCLKKWSYPETIFTQTKEILRLLDSFVEKWKTDDALFYSEKAIRDFGLNHEVSGESDTVKNNPKLKNMRTFYLPDGRKLFFEQHIKLTNGFRLYFYPDMAQKLIYIGYVGPHLPAN
jgi:hypothetical protein